MIATAVILLVCAALVLVAAAYYADKARQHAVAGAATLKDTKTAIAEWWARVEEGR